jgi:uncharacterized protein YggU (UPF0235/DUF167 family)
MSDSEKHHLHDGRSGAALAVRVTPNAGQNEITAVQNDGTVKVRIVANSTTQSSNPILIQFLAEVLSVAPSQIEIVAGLDTKDKLIAITNLDPEMAHERILKYVK